MNQVNFVDEVEEALQDLAEDKQQVVIVLDKAQALTLITTVQFASTYRGESAIKELAVWTTKRLEKIFCAGDIVLEDIVSSGWQRSLPKFSVEQLIETIERVGREEIRFTSSKMEIWALMCLIQLATRHQDYAQTPAGDTCKNIIKPIIDRILTSNLLRAVADSGWDERFDRHAPTA